MGWFLRQQVIYSLTDLRQTAQLSMPSFHKAAVEAGGTCNGKPELRPEYHEHYYGAFVLDPIGNNVEMVSPSTVFPLSATHQDC